MNYLKRMLPALLLLVPTACGKVEEGQSSTTASSSSESSGTSEPVTDSDPLPSTSDILTTTMPPTTSTSTSDGTTTETPLTTTGESSTTGPAVPDCSGDSPHVLLSTNMGDMIVKLDRVSAPKTVDNFVAYVEDGFYDGTIFHRVVVDFVLQGGGYTTDLMEKPTNPPIDLEISALTHVDGAIAMARTPDPNSATSQFYICDGPQPNLDGQYAVFGVLVSGFDVRDAIADVMVGEENGFMDVPVEDVILESASCVAAP